MAISKVKLPDNTTQDIHDARTVALGNGKIFYGTCDTEAGTAAKVVTCSEFSSADLENGTMILIKFNAVNSASPDSLTLNVNGTGALAVKKVFGEGYQALVAAGEIRAITNLFFISKQSNSTYWIFANGDINTTYSAMTQTQLDTGTGTTGYRVSPKLLRDNFYLKSEIPTFVHLTDESQMPATPDSNTIYMIDVSAS